MIRYDDWAETLTRWAIEHRVVEIGEAIEQAHPDWMTFTCLTDDHVALRLLSPEGASEDHTLRKPIPPFHANVDQEFEWFYERAMAYITQIEHRRRHVAH